MKILKKINTFIKSDNKLNILNFKIRTFLQGIYCKYLFAEFGKGSLIYSPVRILGKKYIHICNNVCILNGLRMEAIKYYGVGGGGVILFPELRIKDNVQIGQNFHVIATQNLTIGKDVTISGNVFVSDCYHEYREIGIHVSKQELKSLHTEIGDNCFIGYGAVIQAGVVLGKQCIVGSNAVVLKGDYPDYSVLAGVPAKIIKKYNSKSGKWEK